RSLGGDRLGGRVRHLLFHDELRVSIHDRFALRRRDLVLAPRKASQHDDEREVLQRRHLTMASWVWAFLMHSIAESVMRRPTQLGKSASESLRSSPCIFWMLAGSVMFFCFSFTTTMRSRITSQSAWVAWRPQPIPPTMMVPSRMKGRIGESGLARYSDAGGGRDQPRRAAEARDERGGR